MDALQTVPLTKRALFLGNNVFAGVSVVVVVVVLLLPPLRLPLPPLSAALFSHSCATA